MLETRNAKRDTVAVQTRFAPSCTGRAHPGTLLAGLLAWLGARSAGGRIILRLEDLDPERCRAEFSDGLLDDLRWFGLDFDAVERQQDATDRHHAALDALAASGVLYPCALSRKELQAIGRRAPDGSWAGDNRHRGAPLPVGGWRMSELPLRVALPGGVIAPLDLGGRDLAMDPSIAAGDPVVRRRDGAVAYQLACVVDDAAIGIDTVIRGHDLAPATASQVALQRLLGLPEPRYRHHLLLLEADRERKFSKFHGAVAAPELRQALSAEALCGFLAWCAGLRDDPTPCRPTDLVAVFRWERVCRDDVAVAWQGGRLLRLDAGAATTGPAGTAV